MTTAFKHLCAIAICLALIGWSTAASAHRANVFAWVEGDMIHAETSFSGGKPAMNAPIEVLDAATDKLLTEIKTDAEGLAAFPIPDEARKGRLDLKLVLLAGEGHRGEWIITADEYLGAESSAAESDATPQAETTPPANVGPASVITNMDEAALKRIVDEALEKRLAPMNRRLAAMTEAGPSTSDIVGGIGWILGLFGIAAYFKSRSRG